MKQTPAEDSDFPQEMQLESQLVVSIWCKQDWLSYLYSRYFSQLSHT